MRKTNLFPAIVLYTLSGVCIALYAVLTLGFNIIINPITRVIILAAACLNLYFGSLCLIKVRKGNGEKVMKTTFFIFFVFYLILLFTFVLFDSAFGRSGFENLPSWDIKTLENYIENSLNLVPFASIKLYIEGYKGGFIELKYVVTNLLGNLLAFMPFALFLPLFSRKMNFLKFILTVVLIITSVELLQFLLLSGSCDIDDLILNAGGAAIAYFILKIGPIKRSVEKIIHLKY